MTGHFSLIFSRFLSLLSRRCCLFSATPARSSFRTSYCHPFRCSVHCGRHRMQLTNRNCGHISRERAPCTLWAPRHTHPDTHTPIQFADCGRLLVQLSASDDNKQRHQFGLPCPALLWMTRLVSSACAYITKISPFGSCPASQAKAHVALTAYLYIHTYMHTYLQPLSGCCLPLARWKRHQEK